MKTIMKTALAAVAVLALGVATEATAKDRLYLVKPKPTCPNQPIPKLGFWGVQTCHGMKVVEVRRGTIAWKIGIEPGDIIVSIDGIRLTRKGDYEYALRRAGRRIDLRVQDVRGRGTFLLHANLVSPGFYKQEPVVEYRSFRN